MLKSSSIFILLFFVFSNCILLAQNPKDTLSNKPIYNPNAEQTLVLAKRFMGIDTLSEKKITDLEYSKPLTHILVDSTTPFIHSKLNFRETWYIHVKSYELIYVRGEEKIVIPKDFNIFLDKKTGIPLKIVSPAKNMIYREPTPKESERLFITFGEVYHDIPPEYPKIPLGIALMKCDNYIYSAKEIIINYVIYSNREFPEPRPVWVVYMRGLPPITPRENIPLQYRTNMRYVIDATTGFQLCNNNAPYPLLK